MAFEPDEYCLWAPSRGMGDAVKTSNRRQTNSYRALGGILGRFPSPYSLCRAWRFFILIFFPLFRASEWRGASPVDPPCHKYALRCSAVSVPDVSPPELFILLAVRSDVWEGVTMSMWCCECVISTITRAFV